MTDYERLLQKERERLNRLVDEALQNGTPINETHEIMSQSQRVEALIAKLEKVRGREMKSGWP